MWYSKQMNHICGKFWYFHIQKHFLPLNSGVASHWGGKGGRVPPLRAKNLRKLGQKRENSGKSGKKRKIGKKRQKSGVSFTLLLLTDRAGYATALENNWLKEASEKI